MLLEAGPELRGRLEAVLEAAGFRLGAERDATASQDDSWGHSPPMRTLFAESLAAARRSGPCLIEGEPGTERELVARTVHGLSSRAAAPFIAVKLGALSPAALEDALFGDEHGRDGERPGLFSMAHGGSLFIEDVESLPEGGQAALAAFVREGVARLADGRSLSADVRVFGGAGAGAASRPGAVLSAALAENRLWVPPLREHREDIPGMARAFAAAASLAAGQAQLEVARATTDLLMTVDWPGNARQLQGVIEDAVERASPGAVRPEHLELERISHLLLSTGGGERKPYSSARREVIATFERRYLSELLRSTHGNLSEAARSSGIDRANLRRMLKAHGLYDGNAPPPGRATARGEQAG